MFDHKAFQERLDTLITADSDVWGGAVQALFGDDSKNNLTEFKQRREMFKQVFFHLFQLRAPELVADSLNFLKYLISELRKHPDVFMQIEQNIRAERL